MACSFSFRLILSCFSCLSYFKFLLHFLQEILCLHFIDTFQHTIIVQTLELLIREKNWHEIVEAFSSFDFYARLLSSRNPTFAHFISCICSMMSVSYINTWYLSLEENLHFFWIVLAYFPNLRNLWILPYVRHVTLDPYNWNKVHQKPLQ